MPTSRLRQATAWLPVLMSFTALALVLGHIGLYGAVREPDEGATAHLFQLLIAGQLPLIAIYMLRFLSADPKQALKMMALQTAAIAAAMAPVLYFHL